ncbi:uncharacterized protein BYT42DRAFT_560781 [Radiomyces spectabilis]|uniref:uncharacterized protein n=1 Tax=Radiomyces spectabilis TaxID=64574 RepID=UPI00221F0ACA|nr:uncharacterized protein BYT42DRAFT_560781 [Radiomyces spectabilis]KAI8388642.1 hypothetical protein BYT42DRAFT_560781 [Radiomyces spectabilis]
MQPFSTPHRRDSRRFQYGNATPADRYSQRDTTDVTRFEVLSNSLSAVSQSFSTMHGHFERLKDINDSLNRFNSAFGAFLFGMTANSTTVDWPQAPVKSSFANRTDTRARPSTMENASSNRDRPRTSDTGHATHAMPRKRTIKESNADVDNGKPGKKTRVFVSKINISKIIDRLPLDFRESTERTQNLNKILKLLRSEPDGLHLKTIVNKVKLPQYKVTECLTALVHTKDVTKQTQKGQLAVYKMDPHRYASSVTSASARS